MVILLLIWTLNTTDFFGENVGTLLQRKGALVSEQSALCSLHMTSA